MPICEPEISRSAPPVSSASLLIEKPARTLAE